MAVDRALESSVSADPVNARQNVAATLDELEARLGHSFSNRTLAVQALTHVSADSVMRRRSESYQRLEFLGDRVLGLAVTEMLYAAFPKASEGELSRRLADLVRRDACAEVATAWGVGAHVRLGSGEAQSGGASKGAILADVCEALIGAVFLDAGYPAAHDIVARAWHDRMKTPRRLQDAKTALQEWAQARGRPAPVYREARRSGPDQSPTFVIRVEVEGFDAAEGEGSSKRTGEQAAAEAFMAREGIWQAGGARSKRSA
jgi:ribonuclease-3